MIFSTFLLVVVIEQMTICALQLNKVLMPNPFDRPNAVFALEVTGPEGKWTQMLLKTQNFFFLSFFFFFHLSSPFFSTWQNILYADSELVVNLDNSPINSLKSKLILGETKADVQLDGNWHFPFVDKRFWLFQVQSMLTFLAYYRKCRWSNSDLFGQSSNLWVWKQILGGRACWFCESWLFFYIMLSPLFWSILS